MGKVHLIDHDKMEFNSDKKGHLITNMSACGLVVDYYG